MSTPETLSAHERPGLPAAKGFGLGAVSLILANAGLLIFYVVYDVTLFQLVLVYWCECVWIGIFSAIKLIIASIIGDPYENRWADVSPGSAFLTSLIVIIFTSSTFFSLLGVTLVFILFANDALQLGNPNDETFNHIRLVLGASLLLMAGHAISLIANFFVLGEYKTAKVRTLVTLPFTRCIALLAAIVVSIVFVATVPGFANTSAFAVAVILLKVLWDNRLHRRERRAFIDSRAKRNTA
jgi:hypothetical protein